MNDKGEAADVYIDGSQAVQIGSDNTMYNGVPKHSLDPATLIGRNPHAAVDKLLRKSHDELVEFFIRVSPSDVSDILKVFLKTDLNKVVAALGDINSQKAAELIDSVGKEHISSILERLPVATKEIALRAMQVGLVDAEHLGIFRMGYARWYKNGLVLWSQSSGAITVTGAISDRVAEGCDDWGFPIEDQENAHASPYGTTGVRQEFLNGTVFSSSHGVFLIAENMCYKDEGGSGGWLGFPKGEARNISHKPIQKFEGGIIYSCAAGKPGEVISIAVCQEVVSVLADVSWRPISKETTIISSSGNHGIVQLFSIKIESGTYDTGIYWGEQQEPVMVAPEIWECYARLGAHDSWLGFPVSQRKVSWNGNGPVFQIFEGGTIFDRAGYDRFAIRRAVEDFFTRENNLFKKIGFPTSREYSVNTGGSGSIQYFDNGVLTMRDGNYEAWIRPE